MNLQAIGFVEGEGDVQIFVQTDGQITTVPVELFRTDMGWGFSVNVATSEFSIMGEGQLNPDPSIAYGLAVVDFGAPSVFGFVFATPIVPTGPATTVRASIVGGLTDFSGDGVSLTPTSPAVQVASLSAPLTGMGVDVGAAFAAGPAPAGAFYPYGSFAAGPIPGPAAAGPWTVLSVTTSFALSGGGDIAALTGFAEVEAAAVPDGGAWSGAMALGFLALSGCFFRR